MSLWAVMLARDTVPPSDVSTPVMLPPQRTISHAPFFTLPLTAVEAHSVISALLFASITTVGTSSLLPSSGAP